MPHPQYLGQDLPVYSVEPNWKNAVGLRTIFNTLVREALDTSEERQARWPRSLYGLRYQTLPLDGQETGYIRRVMELAQALPVIMPVWTDGCRLLANAASGATVLSVDDTDPTLFSVLADYVIVWSDFKTWEVLEVADIAGDEITLADATTLDWDAGAMVYPILIGYLERNEQRQLTDEHGVHSVAFEERFNSITNQGLVEVSTPELEFEYEDACQSEITFTAALLAGEDQWLQIAESEDGPWFNHLKLVADPADDIDRIVVLNNDYNGEYFFRIIRASDSTLVRRPSQPEPPTLAPPILDGITTATEIAFDDANRGLWRDGDFVWPYSVLENAFISPTELYLVPRGRFEGSYPFTGSGYVPTWTLPSGAVVKWTRDGSDPTEDTVMKKYEGFEENIAPYRADFRFIIKARCFKDGCKSPVTTILVDLRYPFLSPMTAVGLGQATTGFCDLPLPPDGTESGWSCNILYGGTEGFEEYRKAQTQAALAATHHRHNAGAVRVYTHIVNANEGVYIGWPNWGVGVTYFRTQSFSTSRVAALWDPRQESFMFTYADTTAIDGGPMYLNVGDTIATPSGSAAALNAALAGWVISVIPSYPDEGTVDLILNDLIFTAHHDFEHPWVDDDWVPPAPEEPEEPVPEPSVPDLYGDDFEHYADAADATLVALNDGTGWSGAWMFLEPEVNLNFGDDFQQYTDSADVTAEDAEALNSGDGWDGPWIFIEAELRFDSGDDFQSYADGPVTPAELLTEGSGWASDLEGAWIVIDYQTYSYGGDDFQSYADDPTVTTGDLTSGEAWGGNWIITNYP